MAQTTQVVLPEQQFWVLLIGSLVPLLTYWINKKAPWGSETVKGVVQVVVMAVAGVAYTALSGGVDDADDFVQQTYTAIISGLFAHKILWKPSGVNLVFGATPPAEEKKLPAAIAR